MVWRDQQLSIAGSDTKQIDEFYKVESGPAAPVSATPDRGHEHYLRNLRNYEISVKFACTLPVFV